MTKIEDTVVVFTGKSLDKILSEGGSQAWVLDPARAKKCQWLVCTQNAHNVADYADGNEPHGSAFLVGRISRISPSTDKDSDGRWLIEFSEYARIDQADVWAGDRNPVRYANFDTLGISLEGVDFQRVERETVVAAPPTEPAALTFEQAKAGLAKTFGVDPNAIEIRISG